MAYEAVESLLKTLQIILLRDDDLITPPVKQQIISIHDNSVVLQFNLEHFPQKEILREVANTAEEIIQYLFFRENVSYFETLRLPDQLEELAEEIESTVGYVVDYCKSNNVSDSPAVSSSSRSAVLKGQVDDLTLATELIVIVSNRLRKLAPKIRLATRKLAGYSANNDSVDFDSVPRISRPSPLTSKDDVVGFDEDIIQIRLRLTDRLSYRQFLPIVGMGGIASLKGKVDLLGGDSLRAIEAEELEICNVLLGRRYLIVVDDIWSVEAWDHVQKLFPDDHNGSWIILTTRLMDVATYVAPSWNIHVMRFLDHEQSWLLFNHKVFGDQDCPLELQSLGEKIVKGCGGLPLSIVTVAGLLSTIPRTPKMWQQIEVNDGQLGSILSLSYNHLSPHLRKCFLYMAAFPQDYEIRASELAKLWHRSGSRGMLGGSDQAKSSIDQ
ncbi:putative disease resistance RPP13-like protein 3 [Salvia hispanica]|uniref:putative disease resistance RPP13-like protein 3 n=1 Tax=Salvia hispanica TaxID=49212 RepID=UPI002009B13E|nr:putative disease resistance RPP13-like protein 3 [Salvia hispanica]